MEKQSKQLLITASILGIIGILLGAFAAHGLQSVLTETQIESFQTGVRYQFYHTFLLLFLGNASFVTPQQKKSFLRLIVTGVILFSGSIYVLSLDKVLLGRDIKAIVFATPIGGWYF